MHMHTTTSAGVIIPYALIWVLCWNNPSRRDKRFNEFASKISPNQLSSCLQSLFPLLLSCPFSCQQHRCNVLPLAQCSLLSEATRTVVPLETELLAVVSASSRHAPTTTLGLVKKRLELNAAWPVPPARSLLLEVRYVLHDNCCVSVSIVRSNYS